MRRKQATALIDEIRTIVAQHKAGNLATEHALCQVVLTLDRFGLRELEPCHGNAHSSEVGGNQDHCPVCAPRWGWIGPVEVVS